MVVARFPLEELSATLISVKTYNHCLCAGSLLFYALQGYYFVFIDFLFETIFSLLY